MPRFAPCVVAALLSPLSAQAYAPPNAPSFDLMAASSGATHIVVADTDGRILESWRGDLQPGEKLYLGPENLTPKDALPWELLRFRPESDGAWYTSALPVSTPSAGKGRR